MSDDIAEKTVLAFICLAPSLTIVLAEDDHDHREVVRELLSDEGYGVIAVQNAVEALRELHKAPPPLLVLTDLHMPEMDGRQLLVAMRKDEKLAGIPVIVMTGSLARDVGPVPGAQELIEKPFRLDLLLEVIIRHCP